MSVGGTLDTTLDRAHAAGRLDGGGTTGNERLTAITGVVLLVLLAVIGVTLLRLRALLSVHLFVGLLLIPPVLLKMGSTGYRFVRYYTHDPTYRRKGPPETAMRLIAPLVVLSTLVVFVSGVALLAIGPSSRPTLLPIHKVSFILWAIVTSLHVLGHLPELPRALGAKREGEKNVQIENSTAGARLAPTTSSTAGARLAPREGGLTAGARFASTAGAGWDPRAGRAGRILSLSGALVGGIVLAVVLIPEFAPWLNAQHHLLTGGH